MSFGSASRAARLNTGAMDLEMRGALLSMCYREEKPGVWLKPVGYHLFTFMEENCRWENWFRGVDEKLHVYQSYDGAGVLQAIRSRYDDHSSGGDHSHNKEIQQEFLAVLKMWEAYTTIDAGNGSEQFELSAIDI